MTTNDMTLDARRGLSRRQFVGLAGLGLATIALGNLTGCSKGATQYVYDVVVVGSGGSGTTSAAFAAKNGAKTVCIEKLGWQGGSSSLALGTFYGSGTVQQKELGIDDTHFEAMAEHIEKHWFSPLQGFPVPFTREDVVEVLKRSL